MEIFVSLLQLPCTVCFGIAALVLVAMMVLALRMPEKLSWRYVFAAEAAALIAAGAYYCWCNSFSGFSKFGEGIVGAFALAVYFLILILSWLLWRGQHECK